jgi:hypothetical protein
MPQPLTLFDLFGGASLAAVATRWPRSIQPVTGYIANWPPPLEPWLANLNDGVLIRDVRTAADSDRVSVEARLRMDLTLAARPSGFPFVLGSMPDVEFRIQDMPSPTDYVHLFASLTDQGPEVVLERLPVEIRLPLGLVEPIPAAGDPGAGGLEVSEGTFSVGGLDTLRVVYRRGAPTSVFVHVRLHMTADGEFTLRAAVPVSFSRCFFSGLPCYAVHDFGLVPSPSLAQRELGWLRHGITPLVPDAVGSVDGLLTVRSVHFDHTVAPIRDALQWLNGRSGQNNPRLSAAGDPPQVGTPTGPAGDTGDPAGEFVLDDLAVPFFSPWLIPIPRHVTVGVRRRIVDPRDQRQIFSFDRAPVRAYFSQSPLTGFLLERFFFRSMPVEALDRDLGIAFEAYIVFGSADTDRNQSDRNAFGIGLGENYTLTVAYRREFSSSTGMPEPGTGAAATINRLLHFEIATITVDIMTIRLGYSLGRAITEHRGFGDSAEATVDLFVSMPPTGGENSVIKLRSLGGERVKFAIEGLGWRQGSFQLSGISMPDGVQVVIANMVTLILQEIALVSESGASYLSFSGGLGVKVPSGCEVAFTVRRLRFRVAGDATAPPFKLDGFFFMLRAPALYIEAGGYYTETTTSGVTVREFGLTGTIAFRAAGADQMFGLDLIIGSVRGAAENFEYMMVQIFFRGTIPISLAELRGVRVLFARNMQPRLATVNPGARELRYFNWYRGTNPLLVPGDRRLAAWGPRNDAWALGLGAAASFAGCGSVILLELFGLYVSSPDEQGLLIVIEVKLLSGPNPVGYLALEFDIKNGRFSGVLGVELTIATFLKNPPEWSRNIGRLTGTLFVGNDPPTVALGRIGDQRTWLTLSFEIDFLLRCGIGFGICFEYEDNRVIGGGFFARVAGGANFGIVRLEYNAGFGFVIAFFRTGSTDYSVVVWIEAGFRIVLFGFLRFGISAGMELRHVGSDPARTELHIELRLETPWFLPDVTWTWECVFGTLAPGDLATSTSPLRIAGATEGETGKRAGVHVERLDQAWNGEGQGTPMSVNELRGRTLDEAGRLARFAAAGLRPVATDATIAIDFSALVNDALALGGAPGGQGQQKSGDLDLSYTLTGITVRRRARFGADRAWYPVEERLELGPDFSDPSGVKLSGAYGPSVLTKFWDSEVRVGDHTATKHLLLNARTPFEFATSNPAVDEALAGDGTGWPCCGRRPVLRIHEASYRDALPGAELTAPRIFTESTSRLRLLRPGRAFPWPGSGALAAGTRVALVEVQRPGAVFRAELDEDAAYVVVNLYVTAFLTARLVAFDATGAQVGSTPVPAMSDVRAVPLGAGGPIRRVELHLSVGEDDGIKAYHNAVAYERGRALMVLDRVRYVSLREYLDEGRRQAGCDGGAGGFGDAWSGRGKLFFLPNHEYEVAVTTRVSAAHPSTAPAETEVREYVYFATRGLPGLNAVGRVGEELQPHVATAYAGGRGVLYREEPVALTFAEDFLVALPVASRPPGTSAEHTTLMRMHLLVRPEAAVTEGTPQTATSPDWLVEHRTVPVVLVSGPWRLEESLSELRSTPRITTHPARLRLAGLTQRPGVPCGIPDPRQVTGSTLIAHPQGEADPADATRRLWPGRTRLAATVRLEHAPFVARAPFESGDDTAFAYALDASAGGGSAWSVEEGELVVEPGGPRRFAIFGEAGWNHVQVEASVRPSGAAAGVGVALPGSGAPSRGMFAMVENSGGTWRLALYRRTAGMEWTSLQAAVLPAPTNPLEPLQLRVTAFDDRLRATVGDVVVEADRGELRDGRLALVADEGAAFASLAVAGVDMYTFTAQVSRYRSFRDHVGSFPGRLDEVLPDALGAGTTTSTVAALWTATATQVTAVMAPATPAPERDALFGRWVRELGLPLKDEVTALELSRLHGAGAADLFLLESPEPLDFTEEVTLSVERGSYTVDTPPIITGGAERVVLEGRHRLAAERAVSFNRDVLGMLTRAAEPAIAPRPEPDPAPDKRSLAADALREMTRSVAALQVKLDAPTVRALAGGDAIREVARAGDGLQVELDARVAERASLLGSTLVFAEVVAGEHGPLARLYSAVPERVTGSDRVTARAVPAGDLSLSMLAVLGVDLSGIATEPGRVVGVRPGGGILGGWRPGTWSYTPVDVRVLQDGSGRRALIIPATAGASVSLAAGRYRLRFSLSRVRWSTTEPPDALNRYTSEETLILDF